MESREGVAEKRCKKETQEKPGEKSDGREEEKTKTGVKKKYTERPRN